MLAWYKKKMVDVQEVIHIKRNYLKIFIIFFIPSLWAEWVLEFFPRTSLVPSITYILVIKICKAVFEEILFVDFPKFVYNFCKNFFFELILGVNSSCSGSHLP